MEKVMINKIIKSSAVDGPGNRIVIFFQQCNFNCCYCHNPETINLCTHCGGCLEACPVDALSMKSHKIQWNKDICIDCDNCLAACHQLSTPKTQLMHVDEVMDEVKNAMPFIRGITVSGGECTLNASFITQIFQKAKALNLTTMIDCNGSYDFSMDRELLESTDGVMLDIKVFDPDTHRRLIGADNEMVLKNAVYLASNKKLYEIRTVVVPGAFPNEQTVEEISKLLKPYAKKYNIGYKLICYRSNGVRKEYADFSTPDNTEMQRLKDIALSNGFTNVMIV
ncbi:YjjW family glycine radical enzyme activase [Natronincola ferrireducens]|uniref:Glycine radical enzyme activase, YjjW family n=1 Tax=Natronincola ferrireducens TaxID=393762 RepID=A0A1G9GWA6_9FIRM|nr:YjjW family glycine radical enzyme activase [Natronincola ferrireducens]SDL04835.1 glycine radical enzyme activase, YjjW family [Natronincola ferrireducens]